MPWKTLLPVVLCASVANAQPSARTTELATQTAQTAQTPPAIARADATYFGGRPAEALAAYDSLLAHDSTNVDLLWRASRAALALGILNPRQDSDEPMYLRAEALARTAARLRPDRIEGHYWMAAAMGRRALHADIRTTARLARAVDESATRALAIDSLHAGAHDVLGKLNSEVRTLPAIYRFVAGRLLGVSVARHTSWALAEQHLRRAVELDPTMIIYRLDLGQLYVRTGRMTDAERVLRAASTLPRIHPPDAEFQREALALLGVAAAAIHR
jgi:tetratricopeptide (TPR) repeat protein